MKIPRDYDLSDKYFEVRIVWDEDGTEPELQIECSDKQLGLHKINECSWIYVVESYREAIEKETILIEKFYEYACDMANRVKKMYSEEPAIKMYTRKNKLNRIENGND